MLKCRSCKKPIDFVTMKSGKKMPVNLEWYDYDDSPAGTVLVTNDGLIHTVQKENPYPNVRGRTSHFSDCKQANEWRKK